MTPSPTCRSAGRNTVRPSWRSRIGAYLLYHRRPAGAPADGDQTPGGLIG